jgi:hypothetical protein
MTDSDTQAETPVKRRPGRPSVDHSHTMFARVTPATCRAVKLEAERRGVVPSALIREALDMLLKQAEQRQAA